MVSGKEAQLGEVFQMPYKFFEKRTPLITFACNFSLRLHVTFNFEEGYVNVDQNQLCLDKLAN